MYLNECYFNLNKLFIFHFYIKRFIILLVKVWLGSSIFRIELNYWMSYEWFNLSGWKWRRILMEKIYNVPLTFEQIKLIMKSIENDDHDNSLWSITYSQLHAIVRNK